MYKILVFLLLTSTLYAIDGEISISKDLVSDDYKAEIYLYQDFDIYVNIKPYTRYTNYFRHEGVLKNFPYRDIFATGLEISKDNLYIKYAHICNHPVSSKNSRDLAYIEYGTFGTASADYITIGYRWGK